MMDVPLYYRDGRFSFLPSGPHDRPRLIVQSHYRADVDYQADTLTLGGGPMTEPFTAAQVAVAASGSGMFGFSRADDTLRPDAEPPPLPEAKAREVAKRKKAKT